MMSGVRGKALAASFVCLIVWLVAGTGLVSDDFVQIVCLKDKSFADITLIKDMNIATFALPAAMVLPAEHYAITIWYHFFGIDRQALLDILKTVYTLLAFYCVFRFFSLYVAVPSALLISFLFIFFPSHDATVYWFLGHYLTLSIALYLYSFYLARRGRRAIAFLCALVASFMSYGSLVVAAALFVLCLFERRPRRGLFLALPSVLFAGYYFLMMKYVYPEGGKIAGAGDPGGLVSHVAVQVASFFDAMIGPSAWLKIGGSFAGLSAASLVVGILVVPVVCRACAPRTERYNVRLVSALAVLAVLSLGMFAATGHYPQLAFNLGNRVTIFGSLLVAYLVVLAPLSRWVRAALFVALIFVSLGISDHWKAWNGEERRIFRTMANNAALRNYSDARPIYVTGNQYSLYGGGWGHIEFLCEEATAGCFFNLATGKTDVLMTPLNRRFVYRDGYLIDTKYGRKTKVDGYINVYDSVRDVLRRVDADEINPYIASLPAERRHWIQVISPGFIREISLKLMPRIGYALK